MSRRDTVLILRSEARRTLRDPMMILLLLVPFFIAVLVRFALPLIEDLFSVPGFFSAHSELIISLLLVVTPYLYGAVTGLSILDDRDSGVITAASVTPLGKKGYLIHKLALPLLAGWFGTGIVLSLSGFYPAGAAAFTAVLILLSGTESVLIGMLLASLADNKVQGLVYMKGLGLLFFPGIAAYFLSTPLLYFAAPVPMFWIMKSAYIMEQTARDMEIAFHITAGALVHCGWILFFYRRFTAQL
ncbi:MAG: hypothetical protein ACLFST_12575 [Spirochaetia bacterium]